MTRRTVAVIVVVCLNIGGLGLVAIRNANSSARTTTALCALREDLQHRVDDGTKLLAKHPNGAFGFTPKEIRDGIDNQQRTIQALTVVDCPKK